MNVLTRPESENLISMRGVSKVYYLFPSPLSRLWGHLKKLVTGSNVGAPKVVLSNISFDVGKGETIGVLGVNGAGKSTLLQIICGIVTPSSGSVCVKGRWTGLLELGSGFNSEFSGSENIWTNGLMLGMSEDRIKQKFDEIVSFSEIGEYIDQPVKTYSSGMLLRLAFSVAIYSDPELLIVDEALSVGDQFFQAKCMERIKDFKNSGGTIFFVSHDVTSVRALCSRALLLDAGQLIADGDVRDVTEKYFNIKNKTSATLDEVSVSSPGLTIELREGIDAFFSMAKFERLGNGSARIQNVQLLRNDRISMEYQYGQVLKIKIYLVSGVRLEGLVCGFHIRDSNGYDVLYSDTQIEMIDGICLDPGGGYVFEWDVVLNIREGRYSVAIVLSRPMNLSLAEVEFIDFIPIAGQFSVFKRQPSPVFGACKAECSFISSRVRGE